MILLRQSLEALYAVTTECYMESMAFYRLFQHVTAGVVTATCVAAIIPAPPNCTQPGYCGDPNVAARLDDEPTGRIWYPHRGSIASMGASAGISVPFAYGAPTTIPVRDLR